MNIPSEILELCYAHGQETYPEEACGMISGPKDQIDELSAVHRMANKMDEYHAKDPEQYPRTNCNAYMMDPLEQHKLRRSLKKENQEIRIIYHSHPDVGAYFSEKDQEDALWDGEPRHPGVHFLVCAITDGKPAGAILAVFNTSTGKFEIHSIDES